MPSPLKELRESFGLSIGELAALCGVTYHRAYHAERGDAPLPRMMCEALGEVGVNVAELQARQVEWLEARGRTMRKELRDRLATGGGGRA